jgi:hypothetical protein
MTLCKCVTEQAWPVQSGGLGTVSLGRDQEVSSAFVRVHMGGAFRVEDRAHVKPRGGMSYHRK